MPPWSKAAVALLAYAGALAAIWLLLDDRWTSLVAFVVSLGTIAVSVVRRHRSGEPWVSKNPDDYY